jgi:hypothetical protein
MSQQPTALSENLILYGSPYFENTAKVVLPGPQAANGNIVLNLGSPRPDAGLVSRELLDATGAFAVNTAATKFAYPLDAATQLNGTDNQIIRLQDGSLLASKNGYTWADLNPQPAWFGAVNIPYGNNLLSSRMRNAVYLFQSTDGGASWKPWSMIDAAAVAGGKYAWPQPSTGSSTGWWVGGIDRTELYQDPWSGDIYVSGHGDGGPLTLNNVLTENHAGVIFRTQDGGKTWPTYHTFSEANSSRPYMMTSTLNHRLIVFNITNNIPTLYYSEKGKLSAGHPIIAEQNGQPLTHGTDGNQEDVGRSTPCITRISSYGDADLVWVAYPSLNAAGRQIYVIAQVGIGGSASPSVKLVATVAAEDATATSAVMGAFVSDDLVDPGDTNTTPCALFYWVDSPPSTSPDKNKLLARYQIIYYGGAFPPGYLSVTGGGRRYFSRLGIGHYFSGGYFWFNNRLNFLTQWTEPDGIKANVVSLPPFPYIEQTQAWYDRYFEVYLNPLWLLLSADAFLQLTSSDPPPDAVLRRQTELSLKRLSIAQRRAALARLEGLRRYLRAVPARGLRQLDSGSKSPRELRWLGWLRRLLQRGGEPR